ncbi:SGNH/GDSL hydrolase family protein [Luteibacter aegosomatissinici]|uniref:SGNH/GDSL hydrolase family protein n=1 Tax=Luteibacter aegosomatissinici TaxID=2911539 RepID=UPI001FF7178E|nr:SGNH/GDSL hydrolase family protein [Luteibacter aegosomatissinici]UPG94137.1 SGNH/GDSL hydrolase family protein [Luteibacter aegosomatissinici]
MVAPAFLALGDSYTIGEGVPEQGRWPVQLVARLHDEHVELLAPRIVATTGWTTDELSAAMDAAHLAPGYGLVTLLIGVNNQYRGRSLAEYREQFLALLERAVVLAGDARRVIVVSIPDWGVTPFAEGRDRAAIAHEIDAFNAIARDEAHRAFARWVDVTGISRDHAGEVVDDGLHPSARQYGLWADAILPEARTALRELPPQRS